MSGARDYDQYVRQTGVFVGGIAVLQDGAINQGGLAMTAYNYTQFKDLSSFERNSIEQALLRYCELDTLAMVMLVQGLMELRGTPFQIV